jgi:outer membrane protein OmpA-like peptidoglycan-associated protein
MALLASPLGAAAQPFQGFYIGAGAGFNLPTGVDAGIAGLPVGAVTQIHPSNGLLALGSVGYGLGNGMRFEVEGNFRQASVSDASGAGTVNASGHLNTYGVMANALFDMDIGVPWIFPYIGGGAGYAWSKANGLTLTLPAAATGTTYDATSGNFAYQAIAGLSFPMPGVPGLSLSTEYRFFGVVGNETFNGVTTPSGASNTLILHGQHNNSLVLAVRYAFNVAAPVPVAPPAQTPPAPAPARSYLVFFDWDKATLTDRARQIIKEAADNSTHVQYTRIEVNGYTDTSGTHSYNQGLSIRRARAVQAELVKDGVPQNAISIQGFGDTHLLAPTGPGVREPQNRRVEIVIR